MRVAIVHYHFRSGGVCRVIENTIPNLLEKGIKVALLAEDASGLQNELHPFFTPVSELAYQSGRARISATALEKGLRTAAKKRLGAAPDLWHIHNYHLGKNTSLTEMIASFAKKNERLLLHIHDFPEDGRAANYRILREDLGEGLDQMLYPIGANVIYGVLNQRDHNVLLHSGIPIEQLALLPNPIVASPLSARSNRLKGLDYDQLFLYPTRSISRKNLGELLLLSAMASSGQAFGCTLIPENPIALPLYNRWVKLANTLKLPVEFEMSNRFKLPFSELVSASHKLITTSIAEGFGLAFLEPWLFGKSLIGRNLPEITADFIKVGLRLDGLYDRLEIPLDWIDQTQLQNELTRALKTMFAQYDIPIPKGHFASVHADLTKTGRLDFGRLSEEMQRSVIQRIAEDRSLARDIFPKLSSMIEGKNMNLISSNCNVVKYFFNANRYGNLLIGVYDHLMKGGVSQIQWADPKAILRKFLSPKQFAFLKV